MHLDKSNMAQVILYQRSFVLKWQSFISNTEIDTCMIQQQKVIFTQGSQEVTPYFVLSTDVLSLEG